ncbi:MAG: hypothetical protein H6657_24555 [Ardenticatenaceae bacterium]|nr:hypothetical protein [Ardenticatenaceae bacterium]
MNRTLTVEDPLADEEVTILITLPVGKQAHSERPALLSVGITGQPPVTMQGTLAQIPTLLDQAWLAFGRQAQMAPNQSDMRAEDPLAAPTETAVSPNTKTEPQPDLSLLF